MHRLTNLIVAAAAASLALARPAVPQDDSISWISLIPDSTFVDGGSTINQTGLFLYTISQEIDDGGYPEVTFNASQAGVPNEASPFYINATSGRLAGYQDYWGVQEMWMDEANLQGSLHSVTVGTEPQAQSAYYPTFELDGDGYLQAVGGGLVWGWCPDRDGVGTPGSGYPFSPGSVVLADASLPGFLEGLSCTTFKGLRAVATQAPDE